VLAATTAHAQLLFIGKRRSSAFARYPRDAMYRRLWGVLSGSVDDERYVKLQPDDRKTIVEILVATKPVLPAYFGRPAL
jgi:hypothetical protein